MLTVVALAGASSGVLVVAPAVASPPPTQTTLMKVGLNGPRGVAVDGSGDVFVADSNNNRILELPSGGAQITLGFTGLSDPEGVAVDGSGNVYVLDNGNDRVVELPNGGSQTTLGFTGLQQPEGLAVNSAGDVYLLDDAYVTRVLELPHGGSQTLLSSTGLHYPDALAVDGSGNVYVSDTGNDRVVEIPKVGPQVTLGFTGLFNPTGVAVDGSGNVYLDDWGNGRVLELPNGGSQTTLNVTAQSPFGVAVDGSGNLYVSDYFANRVLELSGGTQTVVGFSGLAGLASVAVDSGGNVYVADSGNQRVLELPGGSNPTDLGFTGLSAPTAVAVSGAGDVYVADPQNDQVVELPHGGSQTTLGFTNYQNEGQGSGVAVDGSGNVYATYSDDLDHDWVLKLPVGGTQATLPTTGLSQPHGVAVDGAGNVYVTDNTHVVKLTPGGTQTTLGFTGLSSPDGIAVDGAGDVFVADSGNGRIVVLSPGGTQTTLGFTGLTNPNGVAVDGSGNVFVTDPALGLVELSGPFTPPPAATLASDANPSVLGQPVDLMATSNQGSVGKMSFYDGATLLGNVVLHSSTATLTTSSLGLGDHPITVVYQRTTSSPPFTTDVLHQEVDKAASTTVVASSVNPAVASQSEVFIATARAVAPGTGTPTGTVTFYDGASLLGTGTLVAGRATLQVTASVGHHPITAVYGGSARFTGSTSAPLDQVVGQVSTRTALASTANPTVSGQPIHIGADVTSIVPGTGTPTGSVDFYDNGQFMATVALVAGHATLPAAPTSGNHAFTATYTGAASFASSTSGTVHQVVGQAGTKVRIATSAASSHQGVAGTITATVVVLPHGGGVPTGTVSFYDHGTLLTTAPVVAGSAVLSLATLPVGSHSITATYSGDANFTGSTSGALAQTIT